MKVVLATSNQHKIAEIKQIMGKDFEFVTLNIKVEEDGKTFAENALKKAKFAYKTCGMPVIADDSGIEIDALNDILGVKSARFMEGYSYAEKNKKILEMMSHVPTEKRSARFKCVAVYYDGTPHFFEGVIEGRIATQPRGKNGFGYDPIFLPYGYEKTMAELPSEVKNNISHRAQAFKKIAEHLKKNEKSVQK